MSLLPSQVSCQHSNVTMKSCLHLCPVPFFQSLFSYFYLIFSLQHAAVVESFKIILFSLEKDTIIYGNKTQMEKNYVKDGHA